MRTEPLISSTVWVALTWWVILTAIAGGFSVVEGHFNWSWTGYTFSRLSLLGAGIAGGSTLGIVLIQSYRKRRSAILRGEQRPIGKTSLGPFPNAWRTGNPVTIKPADMLQDRKLKVMAKLSSHEHVRKWLTSGGQGELQPEQLLMLCHVDPYKRAFLDVLAVYARRPELPATTRAGFHGSVLRSVTLIDHALAVCDKALSLVPEFVYQGLVSRPGRMPVLAPRDSHYMPDTFKQECPMGMIALTALAHDLGKVFTFVEETDGKVLEARGKHGPVGARILTLIPSIQALGAHRLRTMTAVLAHYHACHTLPLDYDKKSGELMIRDDQTVALMEIVIAADKAVCACEASASVALSDYESDVVDFGAADADLIWQSAYLAIMPAEDRKPINGGNHERLGFKFGDKLYLIEEALRAAVIDNMGNILPPGERGGVNTLTHALLNEMHMRGVLVTEHDGRVLEPGQALFTVTFRQPPEKVKKQGKRDPKTYKRMIVMPVKSKLYDFTAVADCPMVPEIIAPALGKHRGRALDDHEHAPEQGNLLDQSSGSLDGEQPDAGDEAKRKGGAERKTATSSQRPGKRARQKGGQVDLVDALTDSPILELSAPKAKKRKYPGVKKSAGGSAPAVVGLDDFEPPPELYGAPAMTAEPSGAHQVSSDDSIVILPTPAELRAHVPAIRLVLAQRHAGADAGGPKVVHGELEGRAGYMTRVENMPEIYAALPWQSDRFQTLIKTTAMPMRILRNISGHLILVVSDD